MTKIDFDHINDERVYEIFQVDGNETEALCDTYLELFALIGKDAMLKLSGEIKSTVLCGCIAQSSLLTLPRMNQTDGNTPRSPEQEDTQPE